MDNVFLVAFITGLTAGGLSCFAVQGGLLTASIAQQLEADTAKSGKHVSHKNQPKSGKQPFKAGMIQPIVLFVLAKLVAYTIMGFFLGWLGSIFAFTPKMQGVIQLVVGIFLVGNALRMFNVHPVFRYFSFEPPAQVTRYIRRVSKRDESWITPLYLGALTVLIPCGVTQAMMAVAVGTGSPWLGALIMFAFVLGTSPTFVAVSWLATSVGGLFQKYFYKVVAVLVLVMGLYGVNAGLTLVGSPLSASRVVRAFQGEESVAAVPTAQVIDFSVPASIAPEPEPLAAGSTGNTLDEAQPAQSLPTPGAATVAQINVENRGYSPALLRLPANQAIELHLVTNQTHSCSRAFTIPELNVMEILPETGEVVVMLPAQPAGKMMDFMCSMGMYTGLFQFE
jgi:sulfite exporter TauE/SafE